MVWNGSLADCFEGELSSNWSDESIVDPDEEFEDGESSPEIAIRR